MDAALNDQVKMIELKLSQGAKPGHGGVLPAAKGSAEIALARDDFLEMAKVLDQHMIDREYVVGDSVTIADFVLAYTLDWAQLLDLLPGCVHLLLPLSQQALALLFMSPEFQRR